MKKQKQESMQLCKNRRKNVQEIQYTKLATIEIFVAVTLHFNKYLTLA